MINSILLCLMSTDPGSFFKEHYFCGDTRWSRGVDVAHLEKNLQCIQLQSFQQWIDICHTAYKIVVVTASFLVMTCSIWPTVS